MVGYFAMPTLEQPEAFNQFMNPLLQTFPKVQYFLSYRVVDYVAWAIAENGQWLRRFSYGDGRLIDCFGQQTTAEKSLKLLDIRSENDLLDEAIFNTWLESHDEDTPLKLANCGVSILINSPK